MTIADMLVPSEIARARARRVTSFGMLSIALLGTLGIIILAMRNYACLLYTGFPPSQAPPLRDRALCSICKVRVG